MSTFPNRLRELRTSSGLSLSELATILKTSKSSINMYERGEREPGFEMLETMADYFNVDMNYLLGYSDTPHSPPDSSGTITAEKLRLIQLFDQATPVQQQALLASAEALIKALSNGQ